MKILSAVLPATGALIMTTLLCGASPSHAEDTNSGRVEFHITVDAPAKATSVRLWAPYPQSDEYQDIGQVKVEGNFTVKQITTDKASGSRALYLEWIGHQDGQRFVKMEFDATSRERMAPLNQAPAATEPTIPPEVMEHTRATPLLPVDGEIGAVAKAAVIGKETVAEKHEAIYNWVVQNTFRDPDVQGCGVGAVEVTLARRGGKCVDISTVYVALARAAGVPAREVFGLRLGKGKGANDITGGHHCWAEYYQPGAGWTQTDPADVRKAMLGKMLNLEQEAKVREYYRSAVGPNRIVLSKTGRGIMLNPPQNGDLLNYFMYPYAEIDGAPVEWLAAQKELKYKITFIKE